MSVLQLLRVIFTTFVIALGMISLAVVLLALGSRDAAGDAPVLAVAAGVVGYGFVSLALPRVVERPLDCSSAAALVATFRTRFFVRLAFAESAALVGFAGFFLCGELFVYVLGAVFTITGYARLAPNLRNLEREDEALRMSGCGSSLIAVLEEARPS